MNKGALTEKVQKLEIQLELVKDELLSLKTEMRESEKQAAHMFREIINALDNMEKNKAEKTYW